MKGAFQNWGTSGYPQPEAKPSGYLCEARWAEAEGVNGLPQIETHPFRGAWALFAFLAGSGRTLQACSQWMAEAVQVAQW
jgi:hypothetical protein